MKIVRSKEPIRLFESNVLEFFTHIHPVVVLLIWVPVVAYFGYRAVSRRAPGSFPVQIPVGIVAGLFLWTLVEYVMHRFVFHFRPRTRGQERISFLFHGVHHAQPMCKTRLVMPPPVSIPLALVLFGILELIVALILRAPLWVDPLFAGLVAGYVLYDMFHYASHHFRVRWKTWTYLRRHHLHHHTQTPDQRFGVTSPLWDIVFGTMPSSS